MFAHICVVSNRCTLHPSRQHYRALVGSNAKMYLIGDESWDIHNQAKVPYCLFKGQTCILEYKTVLKYVPIIRRPFRDFMSLKCQNIGNLCDFYVRTLLCHCCCYGCCCSVSNIQKLPVQGWVSEWNILIFFLKSISELKHGKDQCDLWN